MKLIGPIPSPNIFVWVQYLIIFGFQKDSDFFDLFWITKYFAHVGCAHTQEPEVRVRL
jgi:hypothetical protein